MPRNRLNLIRTQASGRPLTEDGMRWLAQTVDPFHDEDFPPTGYPDVSTDKSIVACIEKTISVACPSTISTGTWDCHIASLPIMAGYTTSTNGGTSPTLCSMNEGSLVAAAPAKTAWTSTILPSTTLDLGPLVIATTQTGLNTFPSLAGSGGPVNFGCLDPGFSYATGNSRLVSMGFEVANTTAEINKQGAVAYYRMPQTVQDTMLISQTSATTGPTVIARLCRTPPVSLQEAMLLSGTVVREAKDGAYIPVTLSETNQPFKTGRNVLYGMRYADGETTAMSGALYTSYTAASGFFTQDVRLEEALVDTCGAYFTGLSLSTTLQVTVRFYVEKIPAPADTQVVVLTRNAAEYDPYALELYKRIIVALPPGSRLADNASGDWWKSVLSILGKAAPFVGTLLAPFTGGASIPIGAGIGTVAGGISQAIEHRQRNNTNKEENKPVPAPRNRSAPGPVPAPRSRMLNTTKGQVVNARPSNPSG